MQSRVKGKSSDVFLVDICSPSDFEVLQILLIHLVDADAGSRLQRD